ncbi:tripartite tricarboxylate transporter substrate binding protein [Alcaligenaceae bacterium LF4-65]|uniref:Tripartite tricarboxylate transporter substrate binding protein n=1 Tax=Zwartia hollandica TaxID=324606 RepID=A0A953NC21_9BURK|nr:tripartite tricarboxylate transporter substrate binding protein [Zwartia hollandica]MBZ1350491.1 tripartite tricarboxylate transporter substrate binding protein [Zwartia hollandica]
MGSVYSFNQCFQKHFSAKAATRMASLALFTSLSLSVAGPSLAQTFPDKPLKIVVGFPPGGGSDLMARMVAERLSPLIGQPVIVENKPGAGSTIAASFVAKSKPDGYTILFGQAANLGIAPAMMSTLNYDPIKDFAPITRLAAAPLLVVGPTTLAAANMKEVITLAKANPNKLSFGSPGSGTLGHLAGEMFVSQAKIKAVHVPYKGQSAAITDIIGNRVELYFSTIAVISPHVESGRIKAFAITSKERSPSFPNVPTVAESGLPGYEAENWYALLAPAGTPPAIVDRLNRELKKILGSPDFVKEIAKEGGRTVGDSPAEFAKFLSIDVPRWQQIVREADLKTN